MEPAENMVLLLEDGTAFEGRSCGVPGEVCGWVHSEHAVAGYQEILTDPGNRGQIVSMTYPLIGNCGVNDEDNESGQVQAAALVVKEASRIVSNWRATGTLEALLTKAGVAAVEGVDTRALALRLRDHGEMRGILAPAAGASLPGLLAKVRSWRPPAADDLIRMAADPAAAEGPFSGNEKKRVVVYDLGAKRSLLAQLSAAGCELRRLPLDATWADMARLGPQGLFVSGGPGDPNDLEHATTAVRAAIGKVPIFAVGLGMQLLARAAGGRVGALKTGHHGVNYPVRRRDTGETLLTVQNHRFVVDGESLAGTEAAVTYENLTDGTVEGIALASRRAFGVQFAPQPGDEGGPHVLFRRFAASMD